MPKSWYYKTLRPDARPASDATARAFIDEIRTGWGIYNEADEAEWQTVPEHLRQQNEILREQRRQGVAGHTQLAAQGLYTTRFRFIHEIIQNADDASYGSSDPYLKITVRQDKIVFESNEQGFTAKDVAALCDIGQSSKSGDEATTGEKGLGFKSVFGIASQVHIESGYWSFSFHHKEGDDGTGMVIPVWTTSSESPDSYVEGTRLTLRYAISTDDFRHKLLTVLRTIRQDFVLALKRLRKIKIYHLGFAATRDYRVFEHSQTEDGNIQIHWTINDETSVTKFLVFRDTLTNMPKGPLRSKDSTHVMIAFPVDSRNNPNIPADGNYVYATLPVRRVSSLRIVVQADFTLLPSRENLNDSTWNQRIVSSLPTLFAKAVEYFCRGDHSLKYQWPHFLPGSLAAEEDCWSNLESEIFNVLAQRNIIEVRSAARFHCPKDVRIISNNFLTNDVPLFEDLPGQEIYISDGYDKTHFKALREMGLKEISMNEMYARVAADIRSDNPRHKKFPYRDNWHKTFLSLMNDMCGNQRLSKILRNLDIIPLAASGHGQWCAPSASDKPCLPYVELDEGKKLEIPSNLHLRKLHPDACSDADPEFERLYCSLGVLRVTSKHVTDRIVKLHQSFADPSNNALSVWRTAGVWRDWTLNYEILFWQGTTRSCKELVPMTGLDSLGRLVRADQLYFQSEEPFDAYTLLKDAQMARDPVMTGYGFLGTSYATSEMRHSVRNNKTWGAWLKEVAGVQFYPPLVITTGLAPNQQRNLHPHLIYVGQNQSKSFIALLQAQWQSSYKDACNYGGKSVVEQISETQVLCDNGSKVKVAQSILPTQAIMAIANKYGVTGRLPLLTLPTTLTITNQQDWLFLERFGVLTIINKQFYIQVLVALKTSDNTGKRLEKSCTELYSQLTETCSVGDRTWLSDQLFVNHGIFVPGIPQHSAEPQWVGPDDCVWTGPSVLKKKIVLQCRYKNQEIAKKFFQDTLALPDATCHDLLSDLIERSQSHDNSLGDLDACKELYTALAILAKKDPDNLDAIVTGFRENNLIYASGHWYTTSGCIWNGRVPTLQSLETTYPRMRSFFVGQLGIKVISFKVVWAQLVKACMQGSEDVAAYRDLIITLSQTLSNEENHSDIIDCRKELKDFAFLPIRGTPCTLAKTTTDFYIVDNRRLGDKFEGRLQFLDFTLEELAMVEPFLQLMDLGCHYLTKCVQTQVSVRDHRFSEELSGHFRHRAYALSRCAIGQRSLKFLNDNTATYDILSQCKVYTCQNLDTRLVVKQHGTEISVLSEKPAVKMELNDSTLSIYCPQSPAALSACLQIDLPKQLMQFLGVQASEAERQVYRILSESDEKLDEVLQQEELPEVSWLQSPSPRRDQTPILLQDSSISRLRAIITRTGGMGLPPLATMNLSRITADKSAYKKLLVGSIIPQARNEGTTTIHLPSTKILEGIDLYEIGAAGELFVYERLKWLGLPQFTDYNWKSTIRAYVNVVPGYNFSLWEQVETADFEYLDVSGDFEKFVRKHSHNKMPMWNELTEVEAQLDGLRLRDGQTASSGSIASSRSAIPKSDVLNSDQRLQTQKPIKFLIEVKATPGPCETPFFVSLNQYNHMEQYCLPSGLRPEVVYVIFRVYNLFSHNIKFKLFVDPWKLRGNMLRFSTDQFQVTGPLGRAQ